jgi:hypothetical protein
VLRLDFDKSNVQLLVPKLMLGNALARKAPALRVYQLLVPKPELGNEFKGVQQLVG